MNKVDLTGIVLWKLNLIMSDPDGRITSNSSQMLRLKTLIYRMIIKV